MQPRNKNEKDKAITIQTANASERKAVLVQRVHKCCLVVDSIHGYGMWFSITTCEITALRIRRLQAEHNNNVFLTSQLGGDIKKEAATPINRRGWTGVKQQINKQAIILTYIHNRLRANKKQGKHREEVMVSVKCYVKIHHFIMHKKKPTSDFEFVHIYSKRHNVLIKKQQQHNTTMQPYTGG